MPEYSVPAMSDHERREYEAAAEARVARLFQTLSATDATSPYEVAARTAMRGQPAASESVKRTIAFLVESLGWQPGNHGENRFARALSIAGVSTAETVQQFRLGRMKVDFAWPSALLGVEVDGWVHGHPQQRSKDAERDAYATSMGWLIIRVDADDEQAIATTAELVARFIDGHRPGQNVAVEQDRRWRALGSRT